MALYTRPELCSVLSIKDGYLTMYITRGKVIVTKKNGIDYIDDKNPLNAFFISKRINKPTSEASKIGAAPPIVETKPPIYYEKEESEAITTHLAKNSFNNRPKSTRKEGDIEESKAIQSDFVELQTEKLRKTNEKLEQEIKKLQLGNSKTQGNFVEIEAIKSLIVLLSESIHTSWETGLENFILKFGAKNQLTRDEVLLMKADINQTSNTAKDNSINMAKKQLRRLQSEAANKRGVGERF